jgi:hypothetical protein
LVDAACIVRLLGEQQPDKILQAPNSETAEQANKQKAKREKMQEDSAWNRRASKQLSTGPQD